jgi:D-arabinose 1-dehydrogenase-like Zn-dependent alcohol dehydrogenase
VLVRVVASGVCHTDLHAANGDWPVKPTLPFIPGQEGVGHVAVQYAKAMGLNVVALDVSDDKLSLAKVLGADAVVNASADDAAEAVRKLAGGGAHAVLVTAPSRPAFRQAIDMARRRGTISMVGLPPGEFPLPIFDVVLKRITIRGSIVGTRRDLEEAIAFAVEGKVHTTYSVEPLEKVNEVFARQAAGIFLSGLGLTRDYWKAVASSGSEAARMAAMGRSASPSGGGGAGLQWLDLGPR